MLFMKTCCGFHQHVTLIYQNFLVTKMTKAPQFLIAPIRPTFISVSINSHAKSKKHFLDCMCCCAYREARLSEQYCHNLQIQLILDLKILIFYVCILLQFRIGHGLSSFCWRCYSESFFLYFFVLSDAMFSFTYSFFWYTYMSSSTT